MCLLGLDLECHNYNTSGYIHNQHKYIGIYNIRLINSYQINKLPNSFQPIKDQIKSE